MTPLAPGSVLAERYVVGHVLGEGGCSVVHAAFDRRLDRDVAIKVWSGGTVDRPDDELRLVAALAHPGVVVVHDVVREAGVNGLVMERLAGPSLALTLLDGPLPLAEVVALGVQVASALAHVHERGTVHADVKPGNVVRADPRTWKLIDFGVAVRVGEAGGTSPGGTLAYASPEQLRHEALTPATDVYSLGRVLAEAVGADAALASLVDRMTDPDPGLRPSAAEVAGQLRRSARTDVTRLLPAGPATAPLTKRPRPAGLWAAACVIVGAFVLLAVTAPGRDGSVTPAATPRSPAAVPPGPVVTAPVTTVVPAVTHRPGKGHGHRHG